MRMILRSLRMSIEARLVVSVSVFVFLGIFISAQDSYGGYCEDGSCCIVDSDCPGGLQGSCSNYRGFCSLWWGGPPTSCNEDSDCPVDEWCVPWGNCVGGVEDGESCSAEVTGTCGPFYPPVEYCRTDEDCEDPLEPDCGSISEVICPGGTCVSWAPCSSCYIATAAFGTELGEKTDVLRSFRDEYLLNNAVGKAFVAAYYKYSPPLADYIAERDWLRSLVRILLLPVIGLVSLFV